MNIRKTASNNIKSLTNKTIKDTIIFNNFINSSYYKKYNTIFIYYSKDDEVDTKQIIKQALKDNKIVALPKIKENSLEFYNYDENTLLVESKYGVLEPLNGKRLYSSLDTLIIVPGRCFDLFNNRIGRGKGYYDRYLKDFKGLKIGICYSVQIFDKLNTSKTDIKMDDIIFDNI